MEDYYSDDEEWCESSPEITPQQVDVDTEPIENDCSEDTQTRVNDQVTAPLMVEIPCSVANASPAEPQAAVLTDIESSIVLEEELDADYIPSEPDVIEYAKWLGMNPESDRDLLYIAREGLKARMPAEWRPCKQKGSDDIYYFNFATGESTWDHPIDTVYREMYQSAKEKSRKKAWDVELDKVLNEEWSDLDDGKEEEEEEEEDTDDERLSDAQYIMEEEQKMDFFARTHKLGQYRESTESHEERARMDAAFDELNCRKQHDKLDEVCSAESEEETAQDTETSKLLERKETEETERKRLEDDFLANEERQADFFAMTHKLGKYRIPKDTPEERASKAAFDELMHSALEESVSFLPTVAQMEGMQRVVTELLSDKYAM
eukprot:gene25066-31477_t